MSQFTWPPASISLSGTIPVQGTVTVIQPTGSNLHAVIDSGTLSSLASGTVTISGTPAISGTVALSGTSPVSISGTVPVAVSGTVPTTISGTVPTTISGTVPTTIASGTISSLVSGTVTISGTPGVIISSGTIAEVSATTATASSVNSSASNVNLLGSNASRKNATFFNDSTQVLYLKLGTTASNTSYTVQLPANGYYELPAGKIYTGNIDGIWASANGAVRITELT